MNQLKHIGLVLLLATATLSSCSTPGGLSSSPTAPKTISQSLVYAETTATSANTLAATLVSNNTITADQGEEVGKATAVVVATVKHARALLGIGDAAGAQAQLTAIAAELVSLNDFINRNKGS